jgi:hypothetical protein
MFAEGHRQVLFGVYVRHVVCYARSCTSQIEPIQILLDIVHVVNVHPKSLAGTLVVELGEASFDEQRALSRRPSYPRADAVERDATSQHQAGGVMLGQFSHDDVDDATSAAMADKMHDAVPTRAKMIA